jgi:EAL and modified HD-GYP domain-containing signal transduction protein
LEKFLARQPIFDAQRAVFGYELLFRSGLDNFCAGTQLDVASSSTADNLFLFGIDRLTQGRRAFLNCTREFLVRDYPTLLPKDHVVLELLESIQVDEEVIAACRRFKQMGYVIALDDFSASPEWRPLVDLADFIKVDLLATSPEEQRRLALECTARGVRLLAEKVETYEDFRRTLGWGYSYFQGYFFSRPEILKRHDIPAYKLNYLRVLQAANRPEIDRDEVAQRIREEASLSYRLLRYLNSPAFFLASDVRSIPHALAMLGERGIRKWISLVAIASMGEDKPQELIVLPLVRARFCELLAPSAHLAAVSNDLFLLGLLSAIDAILDMRMEDVLKEIAIRAEIREALLGAPNPLREVFDLALQYEKGSWEGIDEAAAHLTVEAEAISSAFVEAVGWANGILTSQPSEASETKAPARKT